VRRSEERVIGDLAQRSAEAPHVRIRAQLELAGRLLAKPDFHIVVNLPAAIREALSSQ